MYIGEGMMRCITLLLALVLTGCYVRPTTEQEKQAGEAKIKIFRECMEQASKLERQADDDVSDVVYQCDMTSTRMTIYLEHQ